MSPAKRVADVLVETLAGAGVRRVYGVSGDSLNGITDSIRRNESLRWVHVRHVIAAQIPSSEIGSNYFQETDP